LRSGVPRIFRAAQTGRRRSTLEHQRADPRPCRRAGLHRKGDGRGEGAPNFALCVSHDFKGDRGVYVGFARIEVNAPETLAAAGVGLDVRASDRLTLFGEAGGRLAQDYWSATLRAGVTLRW
jgi:outer membrane autotransporter protein